MLIINCELVKGNSLSVIKIIIIIYNINGYSLIIKDNYKWLITNGNYLTNQYLLSSPSSIC